MSAPTSIKPERSNDDDQTDLARLILNSSVEAIMEAIGPKVFDKLSIWEIILHKATQSQDFNAMDLVIQDVENILMELKLLMSHCFDHVELTRRKTRAILNQPKVGVNISKFLANAIEVESGFWHQKDPDHVTYRNALEVGLLIPLVLSDPWQPVAHARTNDKTPAKKRTRRPSSVDDDPEYVARRRVPGQSTKPAKCAKCGKDYGPGESHKTHMPQCPAALKYKKVGAFMYCRYDHCPNPEKAYKLREDILRHFDEQHFTDEARTIPCTYDGCPQMFATVTLRNIHIRQSHEKLFACHQCPKRFWSEKNLNDHIKNSHTLKENGEAPAKAVELCRKCGKMMARTSLSKHESRCTGYACPNPQWKEVDGEFFCTVHDCHIKHGFTSMYGLRVHFFNSHLDDAEKQFECDHCGKRYADRIMFRKHVKAVHIKPYLCSLCPGRFGNKSQLDEHKKIHTGDKPHACDQCDFKCAKKSNLIDHKQKKHNDLAGRNFHCGICGKVFFTSGRLTSHFRIIHHDGLMVEGTPKKKSVKRRQCLSKRVVLVNGPEKNLSGQAEQDMAVDFLMSQDQADEFL
ncbi:zinc finger protein 675-like [Tigriopus californicus]|uniref:zinc finger protein 675-like n=1 Tax=Tigriopus californicus TaxID=6832 RepID=UPI0027DA2FCF|nr:zinc finger protein 675-like [Tigriopus californicus]